jgi:hypothetical protein
MSIYSYTIRLRTPKPMEIRDLDGYIAERRERGVTDEEIRYFLLSHDWDFRTVQAALGAPTFVGASKKMERLRPPRRRLKRWVLWTGVLGAVVGSAVIYQAFQAYGFKGAVRTTGVALSNDVVVQATGTPETVGEAAVNGVPRESVVATLSSTVPDNWTALTSVGMTPKISLRYPAESWTVEDSGNALTFSDKQGDGKISLTAFSGRGGFSPFYESARSAQSGMAVLLHRVYRQGELAIEMTEAESVSSEKAQVYLNGDFLSGDSLFTLYFEGGSGEKLREYQEVFVKMAGSVRVAR